MGLVPWIAVLIEHSTPGSMHTRHHVGAKPSGHSIVVTVGVHIIVSVVRTLFDLTCRTTGILLPDAGVCFRIRRCRIFIRFCFRLGVRVLCVRLRGGIVFGIGIRIGIEIEYIRDVR